jgi:hypothetical protein
LKPPKENPIVFDVADDAEPAAVKGARPTGVVQILRPLAGPTEAAKHEGPSETGMLPVAAYSHSGPRPLIVAVVAVTIIAITFVSGTYFGRYWPSARPIEVRVNDVVNTDDASVDLPPDASLTDQDDKYRSDLVPDEDSPSSSAVLTSVRPVTRRKFTRPRRTFVAYGRPRRPLRSTFWMSDFTPTTLVIYIENGEIKTRIEPHLAAGYKRQPGTSN